MIGAVELYCIVELIYQLESMPRQKRQHRIKPLLQMLVWVNGVVQVFGFVARALVAAQRFTSHFGANLRELVEHLRAALTKGIAERWIERRNCLLQLVQTLIVNRRGFLEALFESPRHQSRSNAFAKGLLPVEEIFRPQTVPFHQLR